jgi:hypothetical protein
MDSIFLIGFLLSIILAIVWIILPFTISKIVSETKKTNRLLEHIQMDLQTIKDRMK